MEFVIDSIYKGDCRKILKEWSDNCIDSIVTDPPYGLSFMGKGWDRGVPGCEFWEHALRVAKPGAHLLAFGGTRTYHRLACAIEDAGWEIRDCLGWLYGSGFPKSHNLKNDWQGWGTALKPALEPITVARKPLVGTVAENVLTHGTGALNIDGCRVGTEIRFNPPTSKGVTPAMGSFAMCNGHGSTVAGRWPANIIHDGSDEVEALFPCSVSGSASRFFYCAKASRSERGEGNHHPTVKPLRLMRYLCRLVTPPNGIVLDMFSGSGSTLVAANQEGFHYIGCELEESYIDISNARLKGV